MPVYGNGIYLTARTKEAHMKPSNDSHTTKRDEVVQLVATMNEAQLEHFLTSLRQWMREQSSLTSQTPHPANHQE